jgi:hypothetical protein
MNFNMSIHKVRFLYRSFNNLSSYFNKYKTVFRKALSSAVIINKKNIKNNHFLHKIG